MAALFLTDSDVTNYRPPKKRDLRKPVNAKLPASLLREIDYVVKLWLARAKAEGEDEAVIKKIGFTYVLEQFVRNGVDDEWKLFGSLAGLRERPQSEEQWSALVDAIVRHYRQHKPDSKK